MLLALVREASVSQWWYAALSSRCGAVDVDTCCDDVRYVIAVRSRMGVCDGGVACEHVVLLWSRVPNHGGFRDIDV